MQELQTNYPLHLTVLAKSKDMMELMNFGTSEDEKRKRRCICIFSKF
jgi:hypothetical protein